MKRVAQLISQTISLFLEQHGFYEASSLLFVREQEACSQIIGFGIRKASSGVRCMTFGVRVRFPAVEAIKNPERKEKYWGTYGALIHILQEKEPRKYREWVLSKTGLNKEQEAEIIQLLEDTAFPFLEKFSSLNEVKGVLEADTFRNWLGSGPVDRILTLASIYWVQGFQMRAMDLLGKESAGARLMKYRYPLDDLLKIMQSRYDSPSTVELPSNED
jgi:hypothetical protein